ncbi:hypothetical protein OIV19_11875 [Brucella sp. HL-2]|nr:hypothetical protein [Brucella sp. HL-2]MCV9908310.1 hypothetical protein [Brucella sp. HL-2]
MKKPNESITQWLYCRSRNEMRRKRLSRSKLKTRVGSRVSARSSPAIIGGQRSAQPTGSHIVQIWQGGKSEEAISKYPPHVPPANLCLENNQQETLRYLAGIRAHGNRVITGKERYVKRPSGRRPQIKSYTDFSSLTRISTAVAVVLTAEYDRIAKSNKETPPTVNLHEWSVPVLRKLLELGFFEVLGHLPPQANSIVGDDTTKTMQIIRAESNDDLGRIDEALLELSKFLDLPKGVDIVVDMNSAISEAISNMRHHAYPEEFPLSYPHVRSLWVSATVDRLRNSLTVVAYDQGATIPVTYPRIQRWDKVARFLRRTVNGTPSFEFEYDATYIRAAMRYGGSRTDQTHRGKGLPQMLDVLERVGTGRMKVYSRGGWCERKANGKFSSSSTNTSIGGTLIEWNLELPTSRAVVV